MGVGVGVGVGVGLGVGDGVGAGADTTVVGGADVVLLCGEQPPTISADASNLARYRIFSPCPDASIMMGKAVAVRATRLPKIAKPQST